MKAVKAVVGLGAALSLGLAAAVASAHPGGYGGGAGMGPGHGMGWGMGAGGGGFGTGYGRGRMGGQVNPAAAAEARLAYLKSTLQITPAQESAWQAFAAKAKQQADSHAARRTAMQDAATAPAPERLAKRAEIMKANVSHMEAMGTALKDLYAVLTPEQRAVIDRAGGGRGPGGFRGPGGRWG